MMYLNKKNGITLISLVLTIVVLLILAGISVAILTGDNGLISNATKAKEETEIDEEKEIIESSTVQAMGKNKYGDITVDELQEQLNKNVGKNKTTVEKIRKKIVVTINDTQRMYYVDSNGNIHKYEYTDLPVMEDGADFNTRMTDYRTSILTVHVLDNLDVPDITYEVFDVSKNQDETVKAWLIENEDFYDLYIGGKEGVDILNCTNMFAYFSNCISIDLENLYTDKVISFAAMFTWDTNLKEINLENINTRSSTAMQGMFNKCTSLAQIDVSKFDTSNVTNMAAMFYQCAFTKIDLSSFDTSSVTSMNEMFRQCYYIEELDLSNFDTSTLKRTDNMFYNCGNRLKTIYVSNKWTNEAITLSSSMFSGCPNLVGAINYDSQKTDINYANYENGYFTYKALE